MASEKIQIPCRLWPSRAVNTNASVAPFTISGSHFQPECIQLADLLDSNVELITLLPVPAWVHATTPNGKLRIGYVPSVGSGTLKVACQAKAGAPASVSFSISSGWTVDTSATDAVAAANTPRTFDIALTAMAASLVPGNLVFGLLKRLAQTDAADTMAGTCGLLYANLILDDNV